MKKKIFLILLSLILITGCENKENNTNEIEPIIINNDDLLNENKEIELYSDNTRYVFELANTKYVFYYSGDTVTSYYTYIDYNDNSTALYTYKLLNQEDYPEAKKIYVEGKYIVFEWNESEYESLSASNLRNIFSNMKELKK